MRSEKKKILTSVKRVTHIDMDEIFVNQKRPLDNECTHEKTSLAVNCDLVMPHVSKSSSPSPLTLM